MLPRNVPNSGVSDLMPLMNGPRRFNVTDDLLPRTYGWSIVINHASATAETGEAIKEGSPAWAAQLAGASSSHGTALPAQQMFADVDK